MNRFKNMGGFLGYIIGAVILLPLLLIGYNYFFINKNNADKYIVDYMTDSKEINLDIPHYTHSIVPGDELYKDTIFTTSLATKNMGRDGSRQTSMHYRLVYEPKENKYFQITMFDYYNGFWKSISDKNVIIKVNTEDLKNPRLGTIEHPILVFSVQGAKEPLIQKNLNGVIKDCDTNQEQYRYNVFIYLTYVMSKEEFKERFEKGK